MGSLDLDICGWVKQSHLESTIGSIYMQPNSREYCKGLMDIVHPTGRYHHAGHCKHLWMGMWKCDLNKKENSSQCFGVGGNP
mmetsp:Transcript_149278/g.260290  ORF Transcript_149278/g.260290 Transcript_149278/m.260290 type:complete len:82 (-) Transcript_149278:70-315(-)